VIKIDDFEYLPFLLAVWNVVVFWEAVVMSNQRGPWSVTQNHWTTGIWSEVTSVLRQFHVHKRAYTLFTFRELVDFLILAEERVDSLLDTPLERNSAAIQLANMALITLAAVQHLPTIIAERNQIKHH